MPILHDFLTKRRVFYSVEPVLSIRSLLRLVFFLRLQISEALPVPG